MASTALMFGTWEKNMHVWKKGVGDGTRIALVSRWPLVVTPASFFTAFHHSTSACASTLNIGFTNCAACGRGSPPQPLDADAEL